MSLTTSTILLSPERVKDSRDHLRARQQLLKPQDRSKSKRVASCNARRALWHANKDTFARGRKRYNPASDIRDPDSRECLGPETRSTSAPSRTFDLVALDDTDATGVNGFQSVEVPLMSLMKPTKAKIVFGSDFEFVNRPQRVIVLDDLDEDEEDDWEHIPNPISPRKLPSAIPEVRPRVSYAAVVKG